MKKREKEEKRERGKEGKRKRGKEGRWLKFPYIPVKGEFQPTSLFPSFSFDSFKVLHSMFYY